MKTLDLVLKGKWYDMIASGEKKEEYRGLSEYWIRRLCSWRVMEGGCNYMKNPWSGNNPCTICMEGAGEEWTAFPYEAVRFHRGYTSTTMTFAVKEIIIGKGNPALGAPNEEVFIIKLGKRI